MEIAIVIFVCAMLFVIMPVRAFTISQKFAESIYTMFRSKSRYETVKEFIDAHVDYEKKSIIQINDLAKLKIIENPRNSFILHFDGGSDHLHHDVFRKECEILDSKCGYSVFSLDISVVSTSLDNVHIFHKKFNSVLLEYVPLLPSLKVDANVHDLIYSDVIFTSDGKLLSSGSSDAPVPADCLGYVVAISPMHRKEHESFVGKLNDLQITDGSTFVFRINHGYDVKPTSHKLFILLEMLPSSTTGACSREIDRKLVEKIVQMPEVEWIEQYFAPVAFNMWARGLVQSGNTYNAPLYSQSVGLTGADQIVGVIDSGLDVNSCHFNDTSRPIPYNTVDPLHRKVVTYMTGYADGTDNEAHRYHGTHVAGTVAGYSSSNLLVKGHAFNAKIAFFDVGIPSEEYLLVPASFMSDVLIPLYDSGARIMSNSWGSSGNYYTASSLNVDTFMWLYPDALVLFAAGNDGLSGIKTINNQCNNKNGICVGASFNDQNAFPGLNHTFVNSDALAYFSSRGPTRDYRLKPDICAPGAQIFSAYSGGNNTCSAQFMSGTSMATPAVAGAAALVREYFTKGFYSPGSSVIPNSKSGFIPSGALLKAVLLHSGQKLLHQFLYDSISNRYYIDEIKSYPNPDQGYGRIQLDAVLSNRTSELEPLLLFVKGAAFSSEKKHFAQISSTNDVDANRYHFKTSKLLQQSNIRITVAYTDIAGVIGASKVIYNILTLNVVSDASGEIYLPYISGENVLMVDIASPTPTTTYTVTVSASSLYVPQPYAIVITGTGSIQKFPYFASGAEDSLTSFPSRRPTPSPTPKVKQRKPSSHPTKSENVPTSTPSIRPTFKCPDYTATTSYYYSSTKYAMCYFYACYTASSIAENEITISSCQDEGYCFGNQYIELYDSSNVLVGFNDNSEECGYCSGMNYVIPPAKSASGCELYTLKQTCTGSLTCGGQFVVSGGYAEPPPTMQPSSMPTPQPTAKPLRTAKPSPSPQKHASKPTRGSKPHNSNSKPRADKEVKKIINMIQKLVQPSESNFQSKMEKLLKTTTLDDWIVTKKKKSTLPRKHE